MKDKMDTAIQENTARLNGGLVFCPVSKIYIPILRCERDQRQAGYCSPGCINREAC